MRLPYLLAAVLLVGSPATASGRAVERTYETTAVPCGGNTWCAAGDFFLFGLGDGSLDFGLVSELPRAGETRVDVRVRDAALGPVIALVCQDIDGNGGCDTGTGSPDAYRWACTGDVSAFAVAQSLVFVVLPPAGTRISACPTPQPPTVTGSVLFTFS